MKPAETRNDPFVGQTLANKYVVGELIARGGMGRVYRATQRPLGREVALKVLDVESLQEEEIEGFSKRFFREAAAVAKLQHPNTVVVYDYGKSGEDLFMVMELLEGMTLRECIKAESHLKPARAIHIALQVCGSIGEAHTHNMIHRDLKPSNIMLAQRGNDPDFVKVLDFGLVKDEDAGLTQSGAMLGTPRYIAPEQIMSTDVGPEADIYSLGVILYHMLAGRPPFDSESKYALLTSHINDDPEPLSNHCEISPALESLVIRCLAKQPEMRFHSMDGLARALEFCPEKRAGTASSSLPARNVSEPTLAAPNRVGLSRAAPDSPDSPQTSVAELSYPQADSNKHRLLYVLLGALVLGGVAAAAGWLMLAPEPPSPTTQPAQDLAQDLARDSERFDEPRPSPAAGLIEEVAAARNTPSTLAVDVHSEPEGVRLRHEGTDLGDTPTSLMIPEGQTWVIEFSRRGYETREINVSAEQEQLHIRLERRTRRTRPSQTIMQPTSPRTDNRDPWAE